MFFMFFIPIHKLADHSLLQALSDHSQLFNLTLTAHSFDAYCSQTYCSLHIHSPLLTSSEHTLTISTLIAHTLTPLFFHLLFIHALLQSFLLVCTLFTCSHHTAAAQANFCLQTHTLMLVYKRIAHTYCTFTRLKLLANFTHFLLLLFGSLFLIHCSPNHSIKLKCSQ